jgi:hypothetical protein
MILTRAKATAVSALVKWIFKPRRPPLWARALINAPEAIGLINMPVCDECEVWVESDGGLLFVAPDGGRVTISGGLLSWCPAPSSRGLTESQKRKALKECEKEREVFDRFFPVLAGLYL